MTVGKAPPSSVQLSGSVNAANPSVRPGQNNRFLVLRANKASTIAAMLGLALSAGKAIKNEDELQIAEFTWAKDLEQPNSHRPGLKDERQAACEDGEGLQRVRSPTRFLDTRR